jgi:beta-galactosidase
MNFRLKQLLIIAFILPPLQSIAESKLIYPHRFAPQEGLISPIEKNVREELCLNGLWEFQAMPLPRDYKKGQGKAPELPPPNEQNWDKTKIKIPSPWNINDFAYNNLEGPDHRNFPSYPKEWESVQMAWMKKNVRIPAQWTGKRLLLHFEAVAGYAEVYVKGKKVAENFDIFLPFEADITDIAAPGETVEILVGVRKQSLFEDNSTVGRRIIPAGSMWGYMVAGIWQDVFLVAVPRIHISNVFVKPLVSKEILELDITIENTTGKEEKLSLSGEVREWINKAGNDINSAPVPLWELAESPSASIPAQKHAIKPGAVSLTIRIPVKPNTLNEWSPERPNLYGLILTLGANKSTTDIKYERFGWREWTFRGDKQYLNGKPCELRGDSWHFMGVPQLTRRYAYAWFTAIKAANGNAVRPHAQIYPRFYLDIADEMGICVLDETAIWASDGGPKMDSPLFWDACKEHIRRLVLRDRNHASVFGWSVSNENKPVIMHVFNKPELMKFQKQAWQDWRDIVRSNDPTRPWISSDGEEDGEGILPATMGHYGDNNSMKQWKSIGKPWGVGEHSMAYYGTPQQVSKYNGERAYESQEARMEGLANEAWHLIANQRNMGASYVSVFNLAWYGLKPLPLGKKDQARPPSLENDGIFFTDYQEGVPGVQPERVGPYSSTFNPGYDPNLPLYETWPMFEAIRAANAGDSPAWSKWAEVPGEIQKAKTSPSAVYKEIYFTGPNESPLKTTLQSQGVPFVHSLKQPANALIIIDAKQVLDENAKKMLLQQTAKGADLWIWGITPETLASYNELLPESLNLEKRGASSYLPVNKSWTKGMNNSDFYFCEVQQGDASEYGMSGDFAGNGEILLNACNTDWRRWNKRPEETKTASVLRSEREAKGAAPVLVRYKQGETEYYISTLTDFTRSEKGSQTLGKLLKNAGIPLDASGASANELSLDSNGRLSRALKEFWVWSPRPLDNLLIEPDMPKLELKLKDNEKLLLNGKLLTQTTGLPLKQGWNHFLIRSKTLDTVQFLCRNKQDFMSQLKVSANNPEKNKN